jgi:uncharacterized protein YjbI with pentapeptide repeats
LWKADLRDVDLREADLTAAILHDADLSIADLWKADLRFQYLAETDLKGDHLFVWTNLACQQLKEARNWQQAYRDEALACGAPIPTPE